jgi:hypothetical protein
MHPARGLRLCETCRSGLGRIWPRPASDDLAAARTRSLRDVGISLAVLLIVTGLALALAPIDHHPIA